MSRSKAHDLLYGRNPVLETLRANRRQFHTLFLQENLESTPILKEILELAEKLSLQLELYPRKELDLRVKNHQGVLLKVGPYPYVEMGEILEYAQARSEPTLVLLLDQLKDPQNLS